MAKYVIGLDIGGSKITGVLYSGKKVVSELTIVTPKNPFEFERNLLKLADFLSAKQKIQAVGIGMAGLVNEKGIVKYSPNIKFVKDLDLVRFFKLNGFKKVRVDNDAQCFAGAEMQLGQGKKFNNFLALTLGTGIGGGIIINKKLYRGADNAGGEFGHMVLMGDFLEKHFQRARDKNNFKDLSRLLGQAFAALVNIFAPQALILGGSISQKAHSKFLPAAKNEMRKFLFDKNSEPKIFISKLKNASALGAALLVL